MRGFAWKLRMVAVGVSVLMLLLGPVGCAVGASGAAGVSNSGAQAGQAQSSTGVVAPSFFGMVVKHAGTRPAVATGSRRLCDAGVTWAALQPARGGWNWSALDAEVAAGEAQGVEMTLSLGMTPTWASSAPSAPSTWGAGATVMPASLTDWDGYVTAVATRYAGRIAHYEVWNAPAEAANWSGPAGQVGADMALLSERAVADVAAADPAATVVAPAMSASELGDYLAAGGGKGVGSIAVELSLAGAAPEAMVDELKQLRATLATDQDAEVLPVWNDQPEWTLAGSLEEADQAAYAARALILNASFGVARMQWYAWDETAEGTLLLSDTSGQATLAATAYSTVENWLTGATMNGCSSTAAGLWSCQLVRAGAPAWVLWSTAGTVEASALGMSTALHLDGTEETVGEGKVQVDGSPVLLQ